MVYNNSCCDVFDWKLSVRQDQVIYWDIAEIIDEGEIRITGQYLDACEKCWIALKIITTILASLFIVTIPLIAIYGGYQFVGKWIRELHYDMEILAAGYVDDYIKVNEIDDIDAYISNSPSMQILSESVHQRSLVASKPTLTEFIVQGRRRLHILNYTEHKIEFNEHFQLFVNHKMAARFTAEDCQVIATHFEGQPNLIIFDQKDEADLEPTPGFYIDITSNIFLRRYGTNRISPAIYKTSEKIHQMKVVWELFVGFMDTNSFFGQIDKFVIDIVAPIFFQYSAALDTEYPTEAVAEIEEWGELNVVYV